MVKDTLEPKTAWSSESLSKMPIIIKKRHPWISDSRLIPKPVFSPPENPYEFSKLSILKWYNWSNGMFLELQKWQNTPGLFHPSGLGSSALSNPSTCSMDPCCANSATSLSSFSKRLWNANYTQGSGLGVSDTVIVKCSSIFTVW